MSVFQRKDKNGKVIKTKDGRSWYFKCYYKDFDGKLKQYKKGSWYSKNEAKDAESIYLLNNNKVSKENLHVVALSYLDYLKKTKKESTYDTAKRNYKKHIKPYFESVNISDIDTTKIKKWKEIIIKSNYSYNFSNKLYSIFSNILDYAVENFGLPSNELKKVKRFERKNDKIIPNEEKLRYITLEQFNKFIDCVDKEVYKMFFYFAYYTGCRKGEIIALTWKDIDFENKIIHINKTIYSKLAGRTKENVIINSTKNNLNRDIKMSNLLYEKMLDYKVNIMKYKDFKEDWFVFGNTIYLFNTNIDREKDNAFTLSGVPRITMHEFRHSHVSLLINEYVKKSKDQNMKIDTAKFFLMMSNRMGHTLEVMQKTYMHLFPTIQDEIIDLLDNL